MAAERDRSLSAASTDHLASSHQNVTLMFMDIVGEALGSMIMIGAVRSYSQHQNACTQTQSDPAVIAGFTTMSKEVLPAEVGALRKILVARASSAESAACTSILRKTGVA